MLLMVEAQTQSCTRCQLKLSDLEPGFQKLYSVVLTPNPSHYRRHDTGNGHACTEKKTAMQARMLPIGLGSSSALRIHYRVLLRDAVLVHHVHQRPNATGARRRGAWAGRGDCRQPVMRWLPCHRPPSMVHYRVHRDFASVAQFFWKVVDATPEFEHSPGRSVPPANGLRT